MNLRKFGDHKGGIPLPLLAGAFGIPSLKNALDGSKLGHTYWVKKDLALIVRYCQKDVETTARVLLHSTPPVSPLERRAAHPLTLGPHPGPRIHRVAGTLPYIIIA
ncbi:hypothetical protein [Hymenobacter nivis]|uniref:Uncharacterized protein n=1 Tax=Hymenobacter nivis TaxID=1850093 RepID=A0A502HCS8_9BACT|nr:hypothetical protein [Hymenobacter nivis]TPG72467.1 hypothetical protein EAH73_04380 [Hymenobacter nivis]